MKKIGLPTVILFLVLAPFFYLGSAFSARIWEENPKIFETQIFAELAEKLNPAVVNISTSREEEFSEGHPFSPEDPFERFFEKWFGQRPPRRFPERSLGSGFIISKDGYILTNEHVIEHSNNIIVTLADEKEYKARVVGRDPKTDIALIKIEVPEDLPIAPLGNSDKLKIGEWVFAIGNPFGLSHTVTVGIVSAKGRVIGTGPYDNFIQTDASINPGNSGGPLFDTKGEVVGINTAIMASGQGIGFAIPIDMAKELLPQLKEKGKVTRGWMGVKIQRMTSELAKLFQLDRKMGALVANVDGNSPAQKAGIERGDIIVEYDGRAIEEMDDLPRMVAITPIGKNVKVKVIRDGQEKTLDIVIGEPQEEKEVELQEKVKGELGMSLKEITPGLTKELNLSEQEGVYVSQIEPGSPAHESGIQRGDIIKEVNRKPIKTLDDFNKVVNYMKKGESLLLLIKRKDTSLYLALKG